MEKFWTIPNILSILRIVLIIPILNQLKIDTETSNFLAFWLILVAYLTDFFDGLIARKFNMISNLGKILDPIGDKLLAITISAVLYINKKAPFYFFVLILSRDLIISLGAMYAINVKGKILLPIFAGKLTTAVLGVVLSLYPLKYSGVFGSGSLMRLLDLMIHYGTILSSFLLLTSGLMYAVYYFKNFLTTKKMER
ncbi:MAG: CDP-alcohol phosphatidyltransferase family protein [Brevinematales bacterium]|nr:CDP-alcohol phosphatidyltransferase family protein [Brevinematales bacterium]